MRVNSAWVLINDVQGCVLSVVSVVSVIFTKGN